MSIVRPWVRLRVLIRNDRWFSLNKYIFHACAPENFRHFFDNTCSPTSTRVTSVSSGLTWGILFIETSAEYSVSNIHSNPIPAKTLILYKHPSRLLGSLGGSNQPFQPHHLDYIWNADRSDHSNRKGRQSWQRHQYYACMQIACMGLDQRQTCSR